MEEIISTEMTEEEVLQMYGELPQTEETIKPSDHEEKEVQDGSN